MARPHIEFIQSQAVPWDTLGPKSARPGAFAKTLSADAETGAVTLVMKYPAGWHMPDAHYLDSDEEFYVFEGALWVGSVEYKKGDYAYLPAGMPRPSMHSDDGAVVLTFHEGAHNLVLSETPGPMYDAARLIAKMESAVMPGRIRLIRLLPRLQMALAVSYCVKTQSPANAHGCYNLVRTTQPR